MKVLQPVNDSNNDFLGYIVYCVGCKMSHFVTTAKPNSFGAKWSFDGDIDSPTFTPSIHVKYNKNVCHSFIRNGKWQFLNDCTHELAGQTVNMIEDPD